MAYTPPHFTNITMNAGGDPEGVWEPVYTSLHEIEFILPSALRAQGRDPVLFMECARNIDLPLTPDIPTASQRFKYSTRVYLTLPEQTHLEDMSITFYVNEDLQNRITIWNSLKAWYDLVWDSATGFTHFKRELAGIIRVHNHNKKGDVIRRVTFVNAMLKGVGQWSLSWDDPGALLELECNFACDYWEDVYKDDV